MPGQQSHRLLSECAIHFSWFYFPAKEGYEQATPAIHQFLPGVSSDAVKRMRKVVRGWRIPRQTPATLAELAQQYNSVLRGWWEYYGAFYQTAMREIFRYVDRKLEQWARRKYQTLMRHKRHSVEWLDR